MGASDAPKDGTGGVWFTHITDAAPFPLLWCKPFSPQVQAALVTADNPHGEISISDLDLAAMIAHKDALVHHAAVAERTL